MMAQEKGEVEQKQKEREKKEPKDNRNLYLAREGIIREGVHCFSESEFVNIFI